MTAVDRDWSAVAASLARALASPIQVRSAHSAGGGCINRSWRLETDAGVFFVKANAPGRAAMFEAEAAGLEAIAATGTIRCPRPICCGSDAQQAWLVLEHICLGQGDTGGQRELGRRLACMHRHTASSFGWTRDNTIGSTPQPNRQMSDWTAFWREQRLEFQLELAARNGYRGRLQQQGAALAKVIDRFFRMHRPAPSLLHGDLWGGNAAFDEQGSPVIFDPAVYYGDREADLAMTELFGGFSPAFYAGYEEEWPLAPGYTARRDLYNLYHVLNHLNLFGAGYLGQAEQMLDRLLRSA